MKDITSKIQYDGVTTPVSDNAVLPADQYNDRRAELQNAVTNTGLALDTADTVQLSKAMFANGAAAQSMLDSGSVNAVELTPITGASGLRLPVPATPDYSALDGAIFSFKAANTNTGNMTVNVGQTGASLIGALTLFLEDGSTHIPVGLVVSGEYYRVRYDSSGFFVFIDDAKRSYVDSVIPVIPTSGFWNFSNGQINDGGTDPLGTSFASVSTGIGARALCLFKLVNNEGSELTITGKSPDDSGTPTQWGVTNNDWQGPHKPRIPGSSGVGYLTCHCDASGDVDFACQTAASDVDIFLAGYIK